MRQFFLKRELQAWGLQREGYGEQVVGTYLAPERALDVLGQACHQQGKEAGEMDN